MSQPENLDEAEQARRQKTSDLFKAVQLLLEAHTAKYLRNLVSTELRAAIGDTEAVDRSAGALRETLLGRGMTQAEVDDAVQDARKRLDGIAGVSSPDLERVCNFAVEEGMPQIVLAWANALHVAASESGNVTWLRLSLLGEDMLPVGDSEAAEVFDAHFAPYDVLDPQIARDMLKMLRAALPAGKVIPDELAAALDVTWNVVVIP